MASDWLDRAVDRRQFLVGSAIGAGALALSLFWAWFTTSSELALKRELDGPRTVGAPDR